MIIHSESEMIALGKTLAANLTPPKTIELTGDIGTGKTTLTKGIAQGLGITDSITSPSFTIAKSYSDKTRSLTLTHLDFYRLTDPGIMQEALSESIADPHTITVIEWAASVTNLLPKDHIKITINYNDDGTRSVEITQ